jgi:hypothetical protein
LNNHLDLYASSFTDGVGEGEGTGFTTNSAANTLTQLEEDSLSTSGLGELVQNALTNGTNTEDITEGQGGGGGGGTGYAFSKDGGSSQGSGQGSGEGGGGGSVLGDDGILSEGGGDGSGQGSGLAYAFSEPGGESSASGSGNGQGQGDGLASTRDEDDDDDFLGSLSQSDNDDNDNKGYQSSLQEIVNMGASNAIAVSHGDAAAYANGRTQSGTAGGNGNGGLTTSFRPDTLDGFSFHGYGGYGDELTASSSDEEGNSGGFAETDVRTMAAKGGVAVGIGVSLGPTDQDLVTQNNGDQDLDTQNNDNGEGPGFGLSSNGNKTPEVLRIVIEISE